MKLFFSFALALLCLAIPASAQMQPGVTVYSVEMQLMRDGRVFATPQIVIRDGGTTIMTVNRPGGYSMRVSLGRWQGQSSDERFRVASELYFQSGGQWVLSGTPEIVTPLGRQARMDVAAPGRPAYSIAVTVTRMAAPSAALLGNGNNRCTEAREATWRQAMAAPVEATVQRAQHFIPPRTPCCTSGCVTCCGESACCCESTICTACCCTNQ